MPFVLIQNYDYNYLTMTIDFRVLTITHSTKKSLVWCIRGFWTSSPSLEA